LRRRGQFHLARLTAALRHRAKNYVDLIDMIKKSRAEGFAPNQASDPVGTYVLSHGYYDAYFIQADEGAPVDRE